jgi:hypothetical protein
VASALGGALLRSAGGLLRARARPSFAKAATVPRLTSVFISAVRWPEGEKAGSVDRPARVCHQRCDQRELHPVPWTMLIPQTNPKSPA